MSGFSARQKTTPVQALKAATSAAAGIVRLATGTEATAGADTTKAVTPAGTKAAVTSAIQAASRTSVGNKGKIVWIVDDALASQRDLAVPAIEAVGGKLNFAVVTQNIGLNASTMVGSDITTLYNNGHQIMSHSVTHPDMTTQTPAQRMAEWDTSKSILEGLTAVGAITDFVYPNNTSSLVTTREAYARYLRTFGGGGAIAFYRAGETGLDINRATWGTGTHQQVLNSLRRIAVTGETYVLYCHGIDVAGVSSINPTMLNDAVTLASSLGLQWARADEAIVPQYSAFLDYGFETGDLTGAYNTVTSKGSGCTIDIVADTPDAGLPGANSLRMVNDGTGSLNRVNVLGAFRPPVPGEQYTLSCRMRQDKTSGTGGGQLIIRQWDEYGTNLGDTTSTTMNAGGTGSTPWTQVTVAFTPNILTRGFSVWCAQTTMIGTTYFDHLHFGPNRLGVLG